MSRRTSHPARIRYHRLAAAAAVAAIAVPLGVVQFASADAAPGSGQAFVPVVPCRLLDTRVAGAGGTDSPLTSTTNSVFSAFGVQGGCNVPASATALSVNLTVVNGNRDSFVTIYPADAAGIPTTSNLNWQSGQAPVANQATIKLSSSGQFGTHIYDGHVDLIVDVLGYFQPGSDGSNGTNGTNGVDGAMGPAGADGTNGADGANGVDGAVGPAGNDGAPGPAGNNGFDGAQGPQGAPGPLGSQIAAEFFATMPADNPSTVAVGGDVSFPQNGPNTGTSSIAGFGTTFGLAQVGVYRVSFQVPVTEAGQLVLTIDDDELPYTVVGRTADNSQITETALVQTTEEFSVLTVRNPAASSSALTITPSAGGGGPATATLLIELVQAGVPVG